MVLFLSRDRYRDRELSRCRIRTATPIPVCCCIFMHTLCHMITRAAKKPSWLISSIVKSAQCVCRNNCLLPGPVAYPLLLTLPIDPQKVSISGRGLLITLVSPSVDYGNSDNKVLLFFGLWYPLGLDNDKSTWNQKPVRRLVIVPT